MKKNNNMKSKDKSSNPSYLPVAWEYREVIAEAIEKGTEGKIFFFNQDNQVDEDAGKVTKLEEEKKGLFIHVDTGAKIRADRIITLFGKVGAAYDEYNAYGNACMDCTGGL